ncbi:MAG: hypothetical protein ACSHW1_11180 [Yoonia sp.]
MRTQRRKRCNCVKRDAAMRREHRPFCASRSAQHALNDKVADFADIRFSAFANAAFLRTGGSISLVAQRISRYRIFNGAQFIRFGTDLSQRSEPTIDNQHVDKALLR